MKAPAFLATGGPARGALLLGGFLLIVWTLRVTLFPGGADDDGEILYYTQSWAWAYKSGQPPLYNWLVRAGQVPFGVTLGGALAVKFLALAAFYAFSWLAAGRLFAGDRLFSNLAPLGLLACYFIGWETAVTYSHTVLAMAAMAAVLWLLLRLDDRHGAGDYAFVAAGVAVGLLAKHTFALFLLPALAAAWRHPGLRPRVFSLPMLAALAAAGAVAALPFLLAPPAGAGAGLAALAGGDWLAAAGKGLLQFVLAVAGLLSPFVIVAVVLFPGAFRPLARPTDALVDAGRYLEGFLLALLILCAGVILASGTQDVRNNWVVVWFPAVFYLLLRIKVLCDGRADGQPRRLGGFAWVLVVIALMIPAGVLARGLIAPDTCRKCNFFIPYADLAAALRADGFTGGTVVAEDWPNQIAGHLRRFFPEARMVSSRWQDYPPIAAKKGEGRCLVIWRGGPKAAGPATDEAGRRVGAQVPAGATARTVTLTLPRSMRTAEFSYYLLPGRGDCR